MPIKLDLPKTLFAVVSIPLEHYAPVLLEVKDLTGFVGLTRDKDEISLIVAQDDWMAMAEKFPGSQVQLRRKMIRFDAVLDFSVVGFIAEISRALADADISILSLSTYRTDAILVHEASFDRAVAAVRGALVTIKHTILSQH